MAERFSTFARALAAASCALFAVACAEADVVIGPDDVRAEIARPATAAPARTVVAAAPPARDAAKDGTRGERAAKAGATSTTDSLALLLTLGMNGTTNLAQHRAMNGVASDR